MTKITITGASMYPVVFPGDVVEVSKGTYRVGDIVLFRSKGRYVLHRIIEKQKGKIHLRGDNANVIDIIHPKMILGKATSNLTTHRSLQHSDENIRQRIMARTIRSLVPRRIGLWIHQHLKNKKCYIKIRTLLCG
jgi:signal peptidase I